MGGILKMDPLNKLQVAIKNSIDVFYFDVLMPYHVLFTESGKLESRQFLTQWKEISNSNERSFDINNVTLSSGLREIFYI